jgi:hypothetical protein
VFLKSREFRSCPQATHLVITNKCVLFRQIRQPRRPFFQTVLWSCEVLTIIFWNANTATYKVFSIVNLERTINKSSLGRFMKFKVKSRTHLTYNDRILNENMLTATHNFQSAFNLQFHVKLELNCTSSQPWEWRYRNFENGVTHLFATCFALVLVT